VQSRAIGYIRFFTLAKARKVARAFLPVMIIAGKNARTTFIPSFPKVFGVPGKEFPIYP